MGVQLRIRGKVQGVGFRPFVWQLAQQLNLHGDVCNDGDGVEVGCWKTRKRFLFNCISILPPLARIDSVEREPYIWSQLPTGVHYTPEHRRHHEYANCSMPLLALPVLPK